MHVRQRPRRVAVNMGAIAVAAALVLTGCTVSQQQSNDGEASELLSVAASAAVTTWDPIESFSTEALYMGNAYEGLLRKNATGSEEEFTPLLATDWATSEDGLTWTFNIREGVTFHDGEELNADAVKKSIEAAKDHGGASFIWAPLESVEVVDDYTVDFKLAYPAPMDIIAASTYGAWIVSPAALDAAADDPEFFDGGVTAGTGPYTVTDYTPGSEVVLEAFNGYWNEDAAPYYTTVDVSITADAVTAQQMLTSGEIDLATTLPMENIESVAEQTGGEVRTANSPFNFLAYFNTTREPLDDPTVRQALSYAIPYDDLIEVGAYGYGSQSRGPAPKGIFPYNEDGPQYNYDLDKAQSLLEEAGHADGFELTLTYASENPSEARFVPLIKDSFAQIGVDVTVRAELFNQQWENAKADPESAQDIFVVYYWPTYSDAGVDNFNSFFRYTDEPFFNLSYWKNEEYNALLDEAGELTGTDRDAAQAKYDEAAQILFEEAPGAFLYDPEAVMVVPEKLSIGDFNENYPFTTFFASISPK